MGDDGIRSKRYAPMSGYFGTDATELKAAGTPDAGISPLAARIDHVHPLVGLPLGSKAEDIKGPGTPDPGTSTSAARVDHVHPPQELPNIMKFVKFKVTESDWVGDSGTPEVFEIDYDWDDVNAGITFDDVVEGECYIVPDGGSWVDFIGSMTTVTEIGADGIKLSANEKPENDIDLVLVYLGEAIIEANGENGENGENGGGGGGEG